MKTKFKEYYITYKTKGFGDKNRCSKFFRNKEDAQEIINQIKIWDHSSYSFELWSLNEKKPLVIY